jgi:two-component system chemotaxis response regulator CheY
MPRNTYSKFDVLVVDPSPHMASLVGQMLRHLGIRSVVEATTSDQALLALRARPFQVVIVNDVLTPQDGVALTRNLRQLAANPNRDCAVIMMSAAPDMETIAAARDAGITEFLRKPFAAQHIETRLAAIVAAPRPFVETPTGYAGPDRRRKRTGFSGKDKRGG